MQLNPNRRKYPYIVKWHIDSGSFGYYIDQVCNKAAAENAPANAIYHDGHKWHITDDIENEEIRRAWNLGPKPIK